jgi:type IV pilus assembly protein PilM
MITTSKSKVVVGLDVESGSIAATQVQINGRPSVAKTGIVPLAPGVFREGEVSDPEALTEAFSELFATHKMAKNVRLGIANQRIIVRNMNLPVIEKQSELDTAVRFHAQDHIPMPLDEAVLEYQVTGRTRTPEGEEMLNVVAVAARRDMLTSVLRSMRGAGLRPVGIDLSAFGMIRALAPEISSPVTEAPALSYEERLRASEAGLPTGLETPVRLYCNLGDVTNLAVAQGTACLFTRVASFGIEGIAQRVAERRGLTLEHARQWLVHVGLQRPVEEIDGDPEIVATTREALAEGSGRLADELRLSLDYYSAQEGAKPVDGIVACGAGSTVPGLVERLERELGQGFELIRPTALGHLEEGAAARLTLSYGLALEE